MLRHNQLYTLFTEPVKLAELITGTVLIDAYTAGHKYANSPALCVFSFRTASAFRTVQHKNSPTL